ncbi:hypothetical protein [Flavobacterium sp.]|nr:hypothetical protein [Flavobacterium sp.]
MKTKTLPSLSENTFLRYFNFVALYFAQGVPEECCFMAFQVTLAEV